METRAKNKFWHEGAVTVTYINRAKGNEANMVYVMGVNQIMQDEDELVNRNRLFVAMTARKGGCIFLD